MTDISITAASVVAGTGAAIERGIAGATVTAGQVGYLDTASTGKWLLADADGASAAIRGGAKAGIFLNGASLNQPVSVQTEGDITAGGTLTPGTAYYLSDEPGAICPFADLASGDYIVLLGLAKSATVLALDIQYSGVVSAV